MTARWVTRLLAGQRYVGRVYVAWGHHDGLHLFARGWHWHIFVWTRGHRSWPVYSTLRRSP